MNPPSSDTDIIVDEQPVYDWASQVSIEDEAAAQKEIHWPQEVVLEITRLQNEVRDVNNAISKEREKADRIEHLLAQASEDVKSIKEQLEKERAESARLRQFVAESAAKESQTADLLQKEKEETALLRHSITLMQADLANPQPTASRPTTSVNTAPKVVLLTTSMGRGADGALADADIEVKGNVCTGATLNVLVGKATEMFTSTYQPDKIMIHAAGIDSLRARAPKVVNDYKRLFVLIRALCPHSQIILSKLPYKDYHGKNVQRIREGLNCKGRPITFVPGDRLRVDNVNHCLYCLSKSQSNIKEINFLPSDHHDNF